MAKLLVTGGLLLCLLFGSQVEGFQRGQRLLKQPKGAKEIEDPLENELKDLRMELERLNVTHQIPGICSVCKWVIGKVIRSIPADDTKEDVKALLNTACNSYRVFGWVCRKFVNGYLGQIFIDIVHKHMKDPRAICKALHLCWWPVTEKDFHIE